MLTWPGGQTADGDDLLHQDRADDLGGGRNGLVEVADHVRPGPGREHQHLESEAEGRGVDLVMLAADDETMRS